MPVILPRSAHATWLDPGSKRPEELAPLLVPYPGALELRDVSTAVNDAAHDAPDCVLPLVQDPASD
jgi:putative SOS response-associated peptidase YedK